MALRRDRRGSVIAMMAVGLMVTVAAVGAAVDVSRIYLVRAQMQVAVDAAALAGASAFGNQTTTDAGRQRQVEIYFDENFPEGFLGAPDITPDPDFDVTNGVNITTVTATTRLPMAFMQIFGRQPALLQVTARAEMQPKPLEVMVVLDNTGSMQTKDVGGGITRMEALKRAMRNFNDTLHQGALSRPELAMGFVTYNVTTNVGPILEKYHVGIEPLPGFTDVALYTKNAGAPYLVNGRANPLGWMGCVDNDVTVQDVSDKPQVWEAGAWDVRKTLPGELVNGVAMPKIRPYHYKPNALLIKPANTYLTTKLEQGDFVPQHNTNNTSDGRTNNHYLLSPGKNMVIGQALANSAAYKQHFYDFYIGLNANPNAKDDVITKEDDSVYVHDSKLPFKVHYDRVPHIGNNAHWADANPKYGYPIDTPTRSGYKLSMPSPNWQCPEPGMDIQYGRSKQAYLDYINNENYPVMPASGTLHHIGMLWGYRLLTRSDVFTRTNPLPNQTPIRALIFMTDGQTSVSGSQNWSSAYGRLAEKRISSKVNAGDFQTQVMRRFAKVCAAAKADGISVYIVSLKAAVGEFRTCAGNGYYQTEDAATIDQAFQQIAVDLVDLHLTR